LVLGGGCHREVHATPRVKGGRAPPLGPGGWSWSTHWTSQLVGKAEASFNFNFWITNYMDKLKCVCVCDGGNGDLDGKLTRTGGSGGWPDGSWSLSTALILLLISMTQFSSWSWSTTPTLLRIPVTWFSTRPRLWVRTRVARWRGCTFWMLDLAKQHLFWTDLTEYGHGRGRARPMGIAHRLPAKHPSFF